MGILVISALLLWFIVIKPIKYPRFSKFKKTVLIKKNEVIIAQFTCNFKGARRVIFAAKKQKQSALNKLFTGRIDTIVNPILKSHSHSYRGLQEKLWLKEEDTRPTLILSLKVEWQKLVLPPEG